MCSLRASRGGRHVRSCPEDPWIVLAGVTLPGAKDEWIRRQQIDLDVRRIVRGHVDLG